MTSRHLRLGAIAAAAVVGGAGVPTVTVGAEGRQCFFAKNVNNFEAVNNETVNIRVGVNDIYQVKLLVPCPDVRFNQALGIRATSGSDQICTGLDVELISPGPTGAQRCPATSVRKLSAAEVAALPKRQVP